jgi:LysM repeat protein
MGSNNGIAEGRMGTKYPGSDNSSFNEEKAFIKNSILYGAFNNTDMKIYILDEVADHIQRYAGTGLKYELGGVLLGHFVPGGENDILIVSGVLDAKHTEATDIMLDFTIKTWESIQREKEAFYEETEIVGWFSIRPNRGLMLSSDDAFLKNNFSDFLWQIACVVDTVSERKEFYIREGGFVKKCHGYYIYSKTKGLSDLPPKKVPDFIENTESEFEVESKSKVFEEENSNETYISITKNSNVVSSIIHAVIFGLIILLAAGYFGIGAKYLEISKKLEEVGIFTETKPQDKTEYETEELEIIRQQLSDIQAKYDQMKKEFDETINKDQDSKLVAKDTKPKTIINESNLVEPNVQGATPEATGTLSVDFELYKVKTGDTLWGLGMTFYGDGQKSALIMEANGITDIKAGQTIKIPKKR